MRTYRLTSGQVVKFNPRLNLSEGKGLPDATVKTWLLVLRSKLTQYDQKLKDVNIYRLSHWFGALAEVEKKVKSILDKSDEASLRAFEKELDWNFTPGFSPVNNVKKQIANFLEKGKMPTLTK